MDNYFVAEAVMRKQVGRPAFSHVVPLHNVTTNTSKDIRDYLAHFPYFIDEETQEPEKLGDLPEVIQLVSGSAGLDLRSPDLRTPYRHNLLGSCCLCEEDLMHRHPSLPLSFGPQRQTKDEEAACASKELTQ